MKTQTTVVGQPGPVATEGVTATLSRRLLRSIRVGCGPAIFRVRGGGLAATVRRINLDADWRLTRRLSLAASHLYTLQRGGLGLDQPPDAEMAHNTFVVSIIAGTRAN